jgi:ankyrin repeat protein
MVTAQQQAQPSGATGNAPISGGREYEYSVDPRRGDASEQQIIIMMPAIPASRARGLHGSTPLMDAASAGELKAVEALLAKGADVNAQDKFGGTALVYAAREGYTEVVRILIAHGADVNVRDTSSTGLHKAAKNGHLDVVRLLLSHGAEIDAKDVDGQTALIVAIPRSRTDVVLELLRQGADPNAKRRGARHVSALETAVMNRDSLAVTALLAKGADLDQYGASALVLSAKAGLTDIVQILLDGGVSVDGTDAWGQTALHRASAAGRTDIVNVVLASGADVDAVDRSGSTPLMMAVAKGQSAVVSTLLAHGADVNVKDNSGKTALSIAAGAGQGRMVELLLAHGADASSKDNEGNTPLVYAELGGHSAVVRRLLPTDESKGRPAVSLIFVQEGSNQCDVKQFQPDTKTTHILLGLRECPEHLFVSERSDVVTIIAGGMLHQILLSPKLQKKAPVALPNVKPHKDTLSDPKPKAAGYLDDGRLAIHYRSGYRWGPTVEYLYAFDGNTWTRIDTVSCGKRRVCRFDQLDGRSSEDWKKDRRIWHPMLFNNSFVVARDVLQQGQSSGEGRRYLSQAITFNINGSESVLTHYSTEGAHSSGLYTFSVSLQTADDKKPTQLASDQCETAIAHKYLLLAIYFTGGLHLIDIETGERVFAGLKFATWLH